VTDLTAADFRVKEDGKTRAVVSAEAAATPMRVALMIDDTGLALGSIREGAAAFVTRLNGRAEIALTTTGGRNVKATGYTTSTATLLSAINRTFARNASGAFLLDGLLETARGFTAAEVARPVIVSVAVEGQDFSEARAEDVLDALLRSRAQLHVIRVGRPVINQSNPLGMHRGESFADESIQVNAVLGQGPARSGGRSEQLAQHSGIPRLMDQIAVELLNQYAVTYAVDAPSPRDVKLEVESGRRGVRLRAPTRVGIGRGR
jgi:hypothetical protein